MVQARLSAALNLSLHTTSSWEGWITTTNLGSTVVSDEGEKGHLTVAMVKDFRIDLAKALIGEYCSRKRRFCKDHFPRRAAVQPTAATTATITGENRGMKLYGTATPANCFVPQWKRSGGLFSHVSP